MKKNNEAQLWADVTLGVIFMLFIHFNVLAQSPTPSPAIVPAVSLIDGWTAWVQLHLLASLGTIGVIVEVLMRLIPTDKPRSLFIAAASILHSVAKLFETVADFLDKLLQNTKV